MSLKIELQKKILDMIKQSKAQSQYIVLVVDNASAKILSSCCRMFDVMEAGVLVLQNIFLEREKVDLPALYFLEPTAESIRAVIKDFETKKKNDKPQYSAAHLFFTHHVGSEEMKLLPGTKLVTNKPSYLKNLVELNVDFVAFESKTFLLNRPKALAPIYFPSSTEQRSKELSLTSKQIVSVLLTMQERPYIRFHAKARDNLAMALARMVEADLDKAIAKIPGWEAAKTRERGTLLILDRSLDPVAPLMHEYTYQAMVNDLLDVVGELCNMKSSSTAPKAEAKETKVLDDDKKQDSTQILLSEDDSLWRDFRHQHIATVMSDITQQFKTFRAGNKMAQLQTRDKDGNESVQLKDMIAAVRQMPEYKDMMSKLTKHMSLATECMSLFDSKNLLTVGEIEQDMATGLNNDGKPVSQKDLKKKLIEFCRDPRYGVMEKLRLVMIFVSSQSGIEDATRKELMKNVDGRLQKAITNLRKLGVDVTTESKGKPKHSKDRMAEFAKRNKTIPMALMRYVPQMSAVITALAELNLDTTEFPYCTAPVEDTKSDGPVGSKPVVGRSARRKPTVARNWREDKGEEKKAVEEETRPMLTVFVLGGISFSEMRTIYEIAQSHHVNLICGSGSTLTATDMIRQLTELSDTEFQQIISSKGSAAARAAADDSDDEDGGKGVSSGDVKLEVKIGKP